MPEQKPASRFVEIVEKIMAADNPPPAPEPVRILFDTDRYDTLRPQWEEAVRRREKVSMLLTQLESNPDLVKRRKMNDADPVATARADLESAEAAVEALKEDVQDCFIAVTVRPLTGQEVAAIARKHSDGDAARMEAHLTAAIVAVHDIDGTDISEHVTPEIVVKLVRRHRGYGEEQKLWDAINKADAGVDFPT